MNKSLNNFFKVKTSVQLVFFCANKSSPQFKLVNIALVFPKLTQVFFCQSLSLQKLNSSFSRQKQVFNWCFLCVNKSWHKFTRPFWGKIFVCWQNNCLPTPNWIYTTFLKIKIIFVISKNRFIHCFYTHLNIISAFKPLSTPKTSVW